MNESSLPAHVGVYGGGRMGAGIAHSFLLAGVEVTVVEISEEPADAARGRVVESLTTAKKRGRLDGEVSDVAGRLWVRHQPAALGGCDLVVEAAPESPALKASVLAQVEKAAPDAVLATNTSSLSIDELAAPLARPERFLGLHFFIPVPASALVEIVAGAASDPGLVVHA